MRPTRAEPIEVWLRHSRPARFVWRGRLYTVLFVLDHRFGQPQADPSEGGQERPAGQERPVGQEYWLVEATPLRAVAPARYELSHDLATDRWMLSRT
jgi:Family of unknown function (DUF6504)